MVELEIIFSFSIFPYFKNVLKHIYITLIMEKDLTFYRNSEVGVRGYTTNIKFPFTTCFLSFPVFLFLPNPDRKPR